jgi:hypothetical protein
MKPRWIATAIFAACALSVGQSSLAAAVVVSTPLTELSPANQLADELNTIGVSTYPSEYAGVLPTDGNHLTIWTSGDASDILSAVDALAGTSVVITESVVARNFADLMNITNSLVSDQQVLNSQGILLQSWGPVPSSNSVGVTLAPSATFTSDATYVASAQGVLNSMFGVGAVTVADHTQPVSVTASSRDSDSSPFTGGDGLTMAPSNSCTDSWAVSSSSGADRVLTAGHCRPGEVKINHDTLELGTTLEQYVGEDEDDFETIGTNEKTAIWKSGSTPYSGVVGYEDPGLKTLMAVNGDVSGEHTDQIVTLQDGCVAVTDDYYGKYTVCGAGEVSDSGVAICHPGDSGRPSVHQGHEHLSTRIRNN